MARRVTVTEAEAMFRDNLDQMRRDYTQMRDVMHKRMQRMEKSEFSRSEAFQRWGTSIPKLRDMDLRDLPKLYSELSKMVNSPMSTIKGQKTAQARTIASLNEAIGASASDGVNKENYWRVIAILQEARRQKITYGSDKVVELANQTMALDKRQFNSVLDNLDKALQHSDSIRGRLDEYMTNHNLQGYQEVDMTEALDEIW